MASAQAKFCALTLSDCADATRGQLGKPTVLSRTPIIRINVLLHFTLGQLQQLEKLGLGASRERSYP
jgi:hypothetical protein